MPKFVYCSNCGMKIKITRKGLPNYGRIIDLINPHICSEEPIKLDLGSPNELSIAQEEGGDKKFEQNLNKLQPSSKPIDTSNLYDRRDKDSVKSGAPTSLLDNIKSLQNTIPVHESNGFKGD